MKIKEIINNIILDIKIKRMGISNLPKDILLTYPSDILLIELKRWIINNKESYLVMALIEYKKDIYIIPYKDTFALRIDISPELMMCIDNTLEEIDKKVGETLYKDIIRDKKLKELGL